MTNKLQRKTKKNTQGKWLTIKMAYIDREDEPSMNQLAEEFDVSHSQLGRKAKDERWLIQRRIHWDKIGIKVSEKASNKQAESRAKNIMVIESGIAYIINQMKSGSIDAHLSDLDRLVGRLEVLYGGVDSRTETTGEFEATLKEMNKLRSKEYKDYVNSNKKDEE